MGLGDCTPLRQAAEKSGYSRPAEIAPVRGDWLVADPVRANRSAWIGRPAGDGHAENAPLIERARPNQQRTNP